MLLNVDTCGHPV